MRRTLFFVFAFATSDVSQTTGQLNQQRAAANCIPEAWPEVLPAKMFLVLHILNTLLPGNRLLAAFAGSSVRLCALSADRKPTSMTDASITLDLSKSTNVLLNLASQRPFDRVVLIQVIGDSTDLVF